MREEQAPTFTQEDSQPGAPLVGPSGLQTGFDASQGGPLFLNPSAAAASNPSGVSPGDTPPNFDAELVPLDALGPDMPARGNGGPSPGIRSRYLEMARMNALGYTNNQIARHLGYSPAGISVALAKPFVQAAIERYRAQYFDKDAAGIVKEAALDGVRFIHTVINNESIKDQIRLDASKWAAEKATGKPKQEIAVESQTLGAFMDMLKDMREVGETLDMNQLPEARSAEGAFPQASPAATQPTGKYDRWLDDNL